MTPIAERFAAAAETLIGVPFRLRGQSRETGVDCVGLVAAALRNIGHRVQAMPSYGLRNRHFGFVPAFADAHGFLSAPDQIARGDLIIASPGPAQLHLLIACASDRFVHAHAGLGRVVSMPGPIAWPTIHHYRLEEKV